MTPLFGLFCFVDFAGKRKSELGIYMNIRKESIDKDQKKCVVNTISGTVSRPDNTPRLRSAIVITRTSPLAGKISMRATLFSDWESAEKFVANWMSKQSNSTYIAGENISFPYSKTIPDSEQCVYSWADGNGNAILVRTAHIGRGVLWVSDGVVPADVGNESTMGLTQLPSNVPSERFLSVLKPVLCVRFQWMGLCWVRLCSSHTEASELIQHCISKFSELPESVYPTDGFQVESDIIQLSKTHYGIEGLNGIDIWGHRPKPIVQRICVQERV